MYPIILTFVSPLIILIKKNEYTYNILIILIWLKFIQKFIENYYTIPNKNIIKMLRFIINKLDNDTIKLIRKKEQIVIER